MLLVELIIDVQDLSSHSLLAVAMGGSTTTTLRLHVEGPYTSMVLKFLWVHVRDHLLE